ncbi:MAG: hypothetical protein JJT93_13355, partial [Gammaproteobacteria bacterium]|nr:hypothetical protein [Gammaproteobacteria bacterium]
VRDFHPPFFASFSWRTKRGGYRLIYFVRRPKHLIWMLTIYPKSVAESIPTDVLRKIREETEDG